MDHKIFLNRIIKILGMGLENQIEFFLRTNILISYLNPNEIELLKYLIKLELNPITLFFTVKI